LQVEFSADPQADPAAYQTLIDLAPDFFKEFTTRTLRQPLLARSGLARRRRSQRPTHNPHARRDGQPSQYRALAEAPP